MEIHPEQKSLKITRLLIAALVVLGFAAAIYFRFANLRLYPGWYSDEGNHIDLAENWMQGKWQNYGVVGAPYSQRPPLFMYTISAAMDLFGVDISVSRGVSAAANLICLGLAGWIAWKAIGRKEGLLTLWVAAMAPWIVIFGRLGLTYNLMAPFFLMSLIAIWFYFQKPSIGWLIAASVAAALAFSTDYLGILCGVTIGLALLVKRPRALGWFALIFIACVILAILPVLLVNAPVFFTDMRNLFIWGGGVQSTSVPLISILINYTELLRRESWILLGLCGLFLIKEDPLRNLLLMAVGLTLLMVTRAYTPVGVGLHYLMHLFPIFALGLAVFMLRAFELIKDMFNGQLEAYVLRAFRAFRAFTQSAGIQSHKISYLFSTLLAALIVFIPLVWMFLSSFAMITFGTDYIFTGNDDLRLVNVQSAIDVRAYIRTHAAPDDLVMGSPVLIWGLPSMNRTDFLAALAFNGNKPNNYIDVDRSRYQTRLTLDDADFIILDPLAEEFAPQVLPGMKSWLDEIHRWPVVFESGDIKVYHR